MGLLSTSSRLLLFPLLCGLLTLALVSEGTAQGRHARKHAQRNSKQQIAALEVQWKDATLAGDAIAMDKLLSDDYVGISWTGQVNTKTMQLDRVRTRALVVSRMDLSDIKVKVLGPSVAVVTSRAEVAGSNDGHPVDGAFRYTRVYQRLPSGLWKITNFESTRIPNGRGRHAQPETTSGH